MTVRWIPLAAAALALSSATARADTPEASADANALLGRLTLPPGAQRAPSEPADDARALAQPAMGPPSTPNSVEATAWWRAPGDVDAALAYIATHPPAGGKVMSTGSAPGARFTTFQWPAVRGRLGTRQLVITAAPLSDGSAGVRADAQVVWVQTRPAAERIPRGITRVRVQLRGPVDPSARPTKIVARGAIGRVVRLLNSLPAQQPGTLNCPADLGIRVRLSFWSPDSSRAVAIADADLGGCTTVTLALHGRAQPPLTGAAFPGSGRTLSHPLAAQLEQALGIDLS